MTAVGRYFLGLRKDTLPWLFILFFLGVLVAAGFYLLRPAFQPSATLQLGDGIFTTDMVRVSAAQAGDAIDAAQLLPDQAVMLVYDYEQILPVTLQANAAAVDLVWVNNDKKVVYIVKNISSRTINQFTPTDSAKYIIELAAGTVKNRVIAVGAKATFTERRVGGF
jgi:uncharacterized membrane protein (UPF0127 family)